MTRVRYGHVVGRTRPVSDAAIAGGRRPTERSDVGVAILVDHSNIRAGMRRVAYALGERGTELDFHELHRLLAAGRRVLTPVMVADAETPAPVRAAMANAGFEVVTRERGRLTGTEQANDETLAVRLYETVIAREPGVLVLATGDGAGSAAGHGFIPALRAARDHGWGIELASWSESMSTKLRDVITSEGGVVIVLDDQFHGITFAPGRGASTVSLRHRPTADDSVRVSATTCRSSRGPAPVEFAGSVA